MSHFASPGQLTIRRLQNDPLPNWRIPTVRKGVVLSSSENPLEAEDLGAGVARGGARVVAGPGPVREQDVHEGTEAAAQRARGLAIARVARKAGIAHGQDVITAHEVARHHLRHVRDAAPRVRVHARLHLEQHGQAGASPATRQERPLGVVNADAHGARLAATLGDLCGDLGDELVQALLDRLVGAVADGDVSGLDLLLAQDNM